jgi:tetratricopeptide (TPR) repeat protein
MKQKRKKEMAPTPGWGWREIAGAVVIALVAAIIFSPTVTGPFYDDDSFYIVHNKLLQDPDRLWKAWFEPGSFIEYYPIEQTVQYFQWLNFGMDTFGYHVSNIVLHICNALLVWFFLSKFRLRYAWLGGLIYAVHPLFVETVGYISELKNTLSTGPFLLSMCFYVDFEKSRKSSDYLWSLGLFVVAMLCKISMMFFPAVILLYAWYLRGRIVREDVMRAAPFLAVSVILGALCLVSGQIHATHVPDAPPGPILMGGFFARMALIGLTFSFYFAHALLPVTPLPFYPLWKIDPPSPAQFLPWPVFALVAWYLWSKRNAWGRAVILGLGAFALFIVPVLGFYKISFMCLTWVVDHFLYLPMIPLVALVVLGLERIQLLLPANVRRWILVVPAVAVLTLAAETYWYSGIFSNQLELFTYNARHVQGSWFIRYCLGDALLQKGHDYEGMAQMEASVQINPDFAVPHLILGKYYFEQGNYPAAERHFREGIRIDPHFFNAYTGLGASLTHQGRASEALEIFQNELKLDPQNPQAYDGLGMAYAAMGRNADAIAQFRAALAIKPDDSYALDQINQLKPN